MDSIHLQSVKPENAEFLYLLLQERDESINISHRSMPSFEQHSKFVREWPSQYEAWYIICLGNQDIGSIYLTHRREIGIFFKKDFQGKGHGKDALKILMGLFPKESYLANIAPENLRSMNFFRRQSFKLIQHTYELRMK